MKNQLELRKLDFIEEILKVEDENIIIKLQTILKEECLKVLDKELGKEMSVVDFNEMIDKSEEDLLSGRIISSRELKLKVQNWK